jgi:hypothetical protein
MNPQSTMQQVATNAKRIWLAELQNSANLKKQFPDDSVFSYVAVSCRKWLGLYLCTELIKASFQKIINWGVCAHSFGFV